jgi:HAE1 family hydrophobic/amphiphilic exporter-1
MLKKFITRPVLATVVSIILTILGLVGLKYLPITKFPEIAPPSVLVRCAYPGANAETVARAVAPSLEEAINGVENMTYMTSTSGNDGSLTITVYFKLGTNPDQAAVNVQNRVSQATSQLPPEVTQIGVSTFKRQNSTIMLMSLYSTSKDYDETFLQNYAKINVLPAVKRVPGVGEASVFGSKDYSMRVWLNPQKMAAYKISPQEVMASIQDQNLEGAPGKFGENSTESIEYVIRYKGKLVNISDYENIIIRSNGDGSVLHLKDIARIEFGSYNYAVKATYNRKPSVTVAIYQTAGSNANQIEIELQNVLKTAAKYFPAGVQYSVPYSSKHSLDLSIDQVEHTLMEAFILVFIVVFLFLQDFRSTLIPAIAVPVSIIGTFFFMNLFGYSINLLTLFALVLAIGIVVDDAIVVVEAVHSKMEQKLLPAKAATAAAMSEITGAIISITLVMAAVFLPVGFLEGSTGVFYRQFAYTLAIAIIISAINALTLSPALCALFLKNNHIDHSGHLTTGKKESFSKRFFSAFNEGFSALTNKYTRSVRFLIKHQVIAFGGLIIIFLLAIWMFKTTPTGFIPDEDQGFVMTTISLPPGASLSRTIGVMKNSENIIRTEEAVQSVVSISGVNILSGAISSSSGIFMIQLKDRKERGKIKDLTAITGALTQKLSSIKEASFHVLSMPTVPGFGGVGGLEMVLQDHNAGSLQHFGDVTNQFIGEVMKRPEIGFAFTTFNANYPQYNLKVDDAKAKQLGVNVKDLLTVMQAYYGSMQASDFNRFGKYYRVMMQSEVTDRMEPSSLNGIYVKNKTGDMVPITSLVSIERVYGTETVDHFNMYNSININGVVKPGFSTGQALQALQEVADTKLPPGFTLDWKGISREEVETSGKSAFIFALCIIFVYFLLAAQYESYILPLAVMLSIPTGLLGVFIGIKIAGLQNNIYVQIALIMLIGLLAKNAILIVEFALQRRKAGKALRTAAIEGSKARLRPIIMTSLAFIVGMIPLLLSKEGSVIGNHSIGAAAIGGMISGVLLGVFIIPVLFVVFQYLQEKITGPAHAISEAVAPKNTL